MPISLKFPFSQQTKKYIMAIDSTPMAVMERSIRMPERKIAVSMSTLESHNHLVGDIERGVKVYNRGGIEFEEREPGIYWARVPHKGNSKIVTLKFSRDGQDIEQFVCLCTLDYKKPPVCRHVVAAVLAIQGGIIGPEIMLGKTAAADTVVTEHNTAKTAGGGSLDIFATPMMAALMEEAARAALADELAAGQTSVGVNISIDHTAASPLGMKITATATITSVRGRRVTFEVAARDEAGEIGKGTHTRVIVDEEKFMSKMKKRIPHGQPLCKKISN
jgi:predicted thioesterase